MFLRKNYTLDYFNQILLHANYMLVVYVTHKVQCMLTISIKV